MGSICAREGRVQTFVRACSIVLGIVNIALFGFWLSLSRVEVEHLGKVERGQYFEHLSIQITILEVVLTLVGIVLAVLGFFGYQLVVERAEIRADRAARDAVNELNKQGKLGNNGSTGSSGEQMPGPGTMNTSGASKEGDV